MDNDTIGGRGGAPKAPELNLKAIKNLKAAEKFDTALGDFAAAKRSVGKKFNFSDEELIPLPSGGRLYDTEDSDIKNGFIKVRAMTMVEEEILATSRFLRSGSATRMVISNCLISDINAKDILIFDANFILFRLRQITYGDEYQFKIKCDNSICGKEFDHTVNITQLKFEELPENFVEPIVTKLPNSKYTVHSILPRLVHSEELYLKNMKKKKGTGDSDTRFLDNAVSGTIAIFDPHGKEVSIGDWEEFFEALTGGDTAILRKNTAFSTGVDKLDGVVCPYCETDYSGSIPVGPDFFRF